MVSSRSGQVAYNNRGIGDMHIHIINIPMSYDFICDR